VWRGWGLKWYDSKKKKNESFKQHKAKNNNRKFQMAIEIPAWITGIAEVGPVLSKLLDTIKALRSNGRVRGSDLEPLKTGIEDVLKKMGHVAEIGGVLNGYIEYYSGFYTIYTTSDKLIEAVNRYQTDLSDVNSQYHETYWGIIESQFSDIKEVKGMNINVTLHRIRYLNSTDAKQVNDYVDKFNKIYDDANTYLRKKNVNEFKSCIGDMSEQTLTLYNIFRYSINVMVISLIGIYNRHNEEINDGSIRN
jgi:hypothetical protein